MSNTKHTLTVRSQSIMLLNDRFTKVLLDMKTRKRTSPVLQLDLVERRYSVWRRLGWLGRVAPPGFWSFRKKYRWRARCSATYRRRIWQQMKQWWCDRTRPMRGRGLRSQLDAELDNYMSLSKKRLDRQLDNYMSLSKSRLDRELDEYMSMAGQKMQWD